MGVIPAKAIYDIFYKVPKSIQRETVRLKETDLPDMSYSSRNSS